MRKLYWLSFASVTLVLGVGALAIVLSEYAESGRCYRSGLVLSKDELRERTIRSLVAAEVATSERESKYKVHSRTYLTRKSFKPNEVIDAVTSRSIVNIPKAAHYLSSLDSIGSITSGLPLDEYSIVRNDAGAVRIIPITSIEAVSAEDVRKRGVRKGAGDLNLSIFERALGYGNHYFKVDIYWPIDLACCEDTYFRNPKNGLPPAWYAQQTVSSIMTGKLPSRNYLVASNCGELLRREYEGDIRYVY